MEEKKSSRLSATLGLAVTGTEGGDWESVSLDASDWLAAAARLDGGRRLAPFARS